MPLRPSGDLVVQAKLEVGPSDDAYEREAEAVATRIVRSLQQGVAGPADPVAAQPVQRIQRSASASAGIGVGAAGGGLDQDTESRIQSSRGGGSAMPSQAKSSMESAFNADFSAVRIHEGPQSADLNNRIQAKAFTVGTDIYFRDGAPDTSSTDGQHLLAHELTHTIQQTGHVSRIVRRTPAPLTEARVQRTGTKVAGQTSGPVVQRAGEAKAAFDALTLQVAEAKLIRDKALLPGTTLEQLKQVKLDIDLIGTKADAHVLAAEKDKALIGGYRGPIKNLRVQVKACQDKINGPEVAAASSLTNINASLAAFEGAVANRTGEAQAKVDVALAKMKASKTTPDPKKAKVFAASARKQATELEDMCGAFDVESAKAVAKIGKWAVATATDHLASGAADRARQKLTECIDLTKSILRLLRTDAQEAATRAEGMATAVERFVAAGQDKIAKDAAQVEQTKAAVEADEALVKAEAHASKCADEALEAKKLADEAIEAAAEADRAASGANATASSAETTAKSATGSMAFYAKHLGQSPGGDASAIVEKRRTEAKQAEQTAREKRAESDALAVTASEAHATSVPLKEASDAKGKAGKEASEQRATTEKERDAAAQAKIVADGEKVAADQEQGEARQGGVSATATVTEHGGKLHALITAVPDATLRAKIRLAYGDADAQALLAKGIDAQFLLDAATVVKAMIASWTTSDAGDVVRRVEVLGGKALIATFHATAAKTVTAARALVLLDCPGDGLEWFVTNGAATANKLLDRGWSAVDVKRLLRSAEKDAKLFGAQLVLFEDLVRRVPVTVENAEKLLKAGATATFLIDNSLSSIETLLKVPWEVDKIVTLVKAANDLPKPTKVQFDKFCTLVTANGVSVDNAVKMMQGANCTGEYLVDKAFLPVRDAVVDGWSTDQVKAFVQAAEVKAALDKAQIERFYKLVHDNTFTATNVVACLTSADVVGWTTLMNRVDDFIADGNKGTPAAVGGVAAATHAFGPPGNRTRIELQVARIEHFVEGHTFAHYAFTSANIFRGGGNQPSSMWPRGTSAADVAASAEAAMQTAGVQALATAARGGVGSGGNFDQASLVGYVAGVQWFNGNSTTLMQFFPTGGAVPPEMMAAIGRLFKGAI